MISIASAFRQRLLAASSAVGLGIWLLACGIGERQVPAPNNVVFLVIDAAAAKYVGCYGNPLNTTPHIDALAEEGVVFERAYAQATWTLPSAASYMTGKYPPARTMIGKAHLTEPMASLLQQAGLRTAAFSENPYVTEHFGLDTGFEIFRQFFPYSEYAGKVHKFDRVDSAQTVKEVLAWLEEHENERFFLYVHFLPPHAPYSPPPPFAGRFDDGYEGSIEGSVDTLLAIDKGEKEISQRDLEHLRAQYQENLLYADHQVGKIVEHLETRNLIDETMVIVTSDHGEAFLGHGRMSHNFTVYEEMIHVPLIMRFPTQFEPLPERWDGIVELTDLLPTICDAFRLPIPDTHGASLLRVIRDGETVGRVARCWTSAMPTVFAGLVLDDYKLILNMNTGDVELYDLSTDPQEKHDLAEQRPDFAEQLLALLRATEGDTFPVEDSEIPQETLEQLRSLGYLR